MRFFQSQVNSFFAPLPAFAIGYALAYISHPWESLIEFTAVQMVVAIMWGAMFFLLSAFSVKETERK